MTHCQFAREIDQLLPDIDQIEAEGGQHWPELDQFRPAFS